MYLWRVSSALRFLLPDCQGQRTVHVGLTPRLRGGERVQDSVRVPFAERRLVAQSEMLPLTNTNLHPPPIFPLFGVFIILSRV